MRDAPDPARPLHVFSFSLPRKSRLPSGAPLAENVVGRGGVEKEVRQRERHQKAFRCERKRAVAGLKVTAPIATYSMTACSGATDCLRSAALVEPIMSVSGIAHSVKIITIW